MTTHCPICGRRLKNRHDGIFTWRYCPAVKSCGWDVFKAATGSDAPVVRDPDAWRAVAAEGRRWK